MIDPASVGAWSAAAFGAAWAAFERSKSSKVETKTIEDKNVVSEAKAWEARAALYKKMADDSQALLEKEYSAHQATRDFHHSKAGEFQSELLKCHERCADLQEKTDISGIERILSDQQKVLMTMGEGIRELLTNCQEK